MRTLLASLLLLAPLAALSPAQAQSWFYYGNSYGNTDNGYLRGPSGYRGTFNGIQNGDFYNSTFQDNYGTRTRCTTSRIGNFFNTSCN